VTPTRIGSCQQICMSSAAEEYEEFSHQVLAVASMGGFRRFDGKRFHLCRFSAFVWVEHLLDREGSLHFQPYLSMPPALPPCTGGSTAPAPDTAESISTSGLSIWGELVVLGVSQSRSSL